MRVKPICDAVANIGNALIETSVAVKICDSSETVSYTHLTLPTKA